MIGYLLEPPTVETTNTSRRYATLMDTVARFLILRYACIFYEMMLMEVQEFDKLLCNPTEPHLKKLFSLFESEAPCDPFNSLLICKILISLLATKKRRKVVLLLFSIFRTFLILTPQILNFLNLPENARLCFGLLNHIIDDDNIATLVTQFVLSNEKQATIPPKPNSVPLANTSTFVQQLLLRFVASSFLFVCLFVCFFFFVWFVCLFFVCLFACLLVCLLVCLFGLFGCFVCLLFVVFLFRILLW
jgi:hypothetical protein